MNTRPCKRARGKGEFPPQHLRLLCGEEEQRAKRALRGNCQKFPLKERKLERREGVQIPPGEPNKTKKSGFEPNILPTPSFYQKEGPKEVVCFANEFSRGAKYSKKGFHPLLAFCLAKLNTPIKECVSRGVNPTLRDSPKEGALPPLRRFASLH